MTTLFEAAMGGYNMGADMIRRGRAYKAAREQYGDMAGDPGLFSALQDIELAQNRDARAERQTDMQMKTQQQAYDVTDESRREDGILNLVQGLRQARDSGQDLGTAFDQMSTNLPNLGVDPADIPKLKEELLANPKILDSYYEALAPATKTSASMQKELLKQQLAEEKKAAAAAQVSGTIGKLREHYELLDELGGIPNTDTGVMESIGRFASSSWAGRLSGRVIGSEEESLRRTIDGLRPSLLAAMKSAEEMGAKMFDSQKDMELWMSTVTDPTQDIQTVYRLLDEFEEKYGLAMQGVTPETIKTTNTTESEDYMADDVDAQAVWPGKVDPETGMVFQGGDPGDTANWKMPNE